MALPRHKIDPPKASFTLNLTPLPMLFVVPSASPISEPQTVAPGVPQGLYSPDFNLLQSPSNSKLLPDQYLGARAIDLWRKMHTGPQLLVSAQTDHR